MRVLVMGATGFVGQSLVEELIKQGQEVSCFVRKTSKIIKLKKLNVKFEFGDILDLESIKNAVKDKDIVYDLVGKGDISSLSKKAYEKFKKINIIGTENLLKACVNKKIKKIIYFSSTAALGVVKGFINEKTICHPVTPYQRSKFEAEKLVKLYYKQYNLPAVIIRPSMVYGPGDKRSQFFLMYKFVKKGIIPLIGKGDNIIPLVHVNTLVRTSILASERGREGDIYIVTDEDKHTLLEIIENIRKSLNKKLIIMKIPISLAKFIAILLELLSHIFGFKPLLTRLRVNSMTVDRIFDISKAKKELGHTSSFNLEEGIKQTVEWYKLNQL